MDSNVIFLQYYHVVEDSAVVSVDRILRDAASHLGELAPHDLGEVANDSRRVGRVPHEHVLGHILDLAVPRLNRCGEVEVDGAPAARSVSKFRSVVMVGAAGPAVSSGGKGVGGRTNTPKQAFYPESRPIL